MNEIFINRMKELLQDEYPDFEKSLTQKQVKALYFNHNLKNLEPIIKKFELKPHHYVRDGYYYDYEKYPLGKHPYHDCGLFYIQEPSAMIVASLLDIQPNDRILDMCAAPGGKTCYVASQLLQTGLVVANDINPLRAGILSGNIERLGLKNTIVTNTEPKKITAQLPEYFDKVILDAPCSGEGMFRKLDQAIETWSLEKVQECAYIQKQLVLQAYQALKPGGQLIYSTCTYNKEENEDIVDYLLEKCPDLQLVPIPLKEGMQPGIHHLECCRLYPHHHHGEGQFIALFKKQGNPQQTKVKTIKPNLKTPEKKLIENFYQQSLNISVPKQIINHQGHLYEIGSDFPELNKIKILRTGLYLGECKKERFEPGYSLSHTLKKEDVKLSLSFKPDSEEIRKYLKGETLEGDHQKGYGVIFVDDYPLSFYKQNNNIVKNLFPKGLRKKY